MVHDVAEGENITRLDLQTTFLMSFSDDDEWEGAAGASLQRSLEEPIYTNSCIQIVHEYCLRYEPFRQCQ